MSLFISTDENPLRARAHLEGRLIEQAKSAGREGREEFPIQWLAPSRV
jgi:hypothetical protein